MAFVVEMENGIRFGAFTFVPIDSYEHYDKESEEWKAIVDPQSFLFTFKDSKPMKYMMKEEKKIEPMFVLCKEWEKCLFAVGNGERYDMWIGKKGKKSYCYDGKKCTYNYLDEKKVLTGYSGYGEKDKFDIKRVVVIQFK